MNKEVIIPNGWVAFVKNKRCYGYSEFKNDSKYSGNLDMITRPTEAELKAFLDESGYVCTVVVKTTTSKPE